MSKEEEGAQTPEAEEGKESLYINEVTLVGHCEEAPKAVKTESGKLRASFGLAVPRGRGKTFVRIVAWESLAKQCATARQDGLIRINGQLRSWKPEGQPTTLEVVAQIVQVMDAPKQQELAGV